MTNASPVVVKPLLPAPTPTNTVATNLVKTNPPPNIPLTVINRLPDKPKTNDLAQTQKSQQRTNDTNPSGVSIGPNVPLPPPSPDIIRISFP